MKMLVTGGAGFIGSNFINFTIPEYQNYKIINADKLTYAANLQNLSVVENHQNYYFDKTDIADHGQLDRLFEKCKPDLVIHFAAESHVDRSIHGPSEFIQTNIIGTFNLLETCRRYWSEPKGKLFVHVSTDEVYGSLGSTGFFTEETAYDPSSPYSATKASSDHLAKAYHRTYGLPVIITNCSNNYGPYQFPEKLVPLMIINALEGKPLPVYGKGDNVRDWLYVEDHCRAIWSVIEKGEPGQTYNIGGRNEWRNIDIVHKICELLACETGKSAVHYKKLISFVNDRPGHDFRYAVDCSKIINGLGWKPLEDFQSGLLKTIRWYLKHKDWIKNIQSGAYRLWLEQNYGSRN